MTNRTVLLIVVGWSSLIQAENRVVNPDFDLDNSGWEAAGVWVAVDRDGCGNSGSVEASAAVSACFPVSGGETLAVEFWYRFQESGGTGALAGVHAYSETDCGGTFSNPVFLDAPGPVGQWLRTTAEFSVPAGALSARLFSQFIFAQDPVGVDGAYVGPVYLFNDGFETQETCRWSSVQE